jgi:hypothetical protein
MNSLSYMAACAITSGTSVKRMLMFCTYFLTYHDIWAFKVTMYILIHGIDTVRKFTETVTDASKEVGLEINVEKTKFMLLSRHQNEG